MSFWRRLFGLKEITPCIPPASSIPKDTTEEVVEKVEVVPGFNVTVSVECGTGKWKPIPGEVEWGIGCLEGLSERDRTELLSLFSNNASVTREMMYLTTLGMCFEWPDFNDWFARFKHSKRWPAMWDTGTGDHSVLRSFEQDLTLPPNGWKQKFHSLSTGARMLMTKQQWNGRLEIGDLPLKTFTTFVEELVTSGFAVSGELLSVPERLELMRIEEVRQLQKEIGVAPARSKADLVAHILAHPNQTEVEHQIGSARFAKARDRVSSSLEDFDGFRSFILEHTINARMASFRDYDSAKRCGGSMKVTVDIQDSCSACKLAAAALRKLSVVSLDRLPPFHPGCRCYPSFNIAD